MTVNRRSFLQQSITSLAAVAGGSTLLDACSRANSAVDSAAGVDTATRVATNKLDRVGIQLYTLRSEMQKNVEKTLERVAGIGYKEVEFAGYFGRTPQQIADALKQNGLTSPSSHIDFSQPWDKTLADAKTAGHQYVVVPWIDEKNRTAEAFKRLAEEMNKRGDAAQKAGLQLAYHNHDFEFKQADGGKMLYDMLLESTDPKLVQMEMDLYWITNGGQDPMTYWNKYPGRFPLLHIKDRKPDGKMAEVGGGVIPFPGYFKQNGLSGAKHFFVEHDNPTDAFASATASYNYLSKVTF